MCYGSGRTQRLRVRVDGAGAEHIPSEQARSGIAKSLNAILCLGQVDEESRKAHGFMRRRKSIKSMFNDIIVEQWAPIVVKLNFSECLRCASNFI